MTVENLLWNFSDQLAVILVKFSQDMHGVLKTGSLPGCLSDVPFLSVASVEQEGPLGNRGQSALSAFCLFTRK